MPDSKEVQELIDKIRGKTPDEKTKDTVDAILKAEKELEETKAKEEADKKASLLDKIKAEEEKLKNQEEEEDEDEDETSEDESEEDDSEEKIKQLTEQMEKMTEEIEALKKRKNYRTKPPKAKKVDAKDLPDFIVQNAQNIQNKDYEVMC
jgi:hypothetical protein